MTIRENLEKREHDILSPYAAFSDESKGAIHTKSNVTCVQFIKETVTGFFIPNRFGG